MQMREFWGLDVVDETGYGTYFATLLRGAGRPTAGPAVRIVIRDDARLDEGSFTVTVPPDGSAEISVVGAPLAGVNAGVRWVVDSVSRAPGSAMQLPIGLWADGPKMPYLTWFTWDHSTNWDVEALGQQEIGALNTYQKPPNTFLDDYRRLVDFASQLRVPAVTIYGLLRDIHGGVDAARTLCDYAAARGVRIVAGVGINAYGGVYFDGNHEYNLATWLRKNPSLAAEIDRMPGFHIEEMPPMSFPQNEFMLAACPSNPRNLEWNADAIEWLVAEVGVAGVNFETGDYGTCQCERCTGNALSATRKTWSYEAMASNYPTLIERANTANRHAWPLWNFVEMYWDSIFDVDAQRPVASLPDSCLYQYCFNFTYWLSQRDKLGRSQVEGLPHSTNILRTHAASQWNAQRYAMCAPVIADMATTAGRAGMRGMTLFTEASSYSPANELNYVAHARFCWDPELTWDRFWESEVKPRLGDDALTFFDLTRTLEDPGSSPAMLDDGVRIALERAGDREVGRRWLWLAERLSRASFNRQWSEQL